MNYKIALKSYWKEQKADLLSEEEQSELAGISELSRTFTLINAQLASKPTGCLNQKNTKVPSA